MIDRAALLDMLKHMSGETQLGKKDHWVQWDIEGDILTVRYFDGKPDETLPIFRQWRLVPIGDGG